MSDWNKDDWGKYTSNSIAMDIEEKIKEIQTELKKLTTERDSADVRIKLLTKSVKAFEKLKVKADEIVNG